MTCSPIPLPPCSPGWPCCPRNPRLTSYSYRLSHDHQQRFLAVLGKQMIGAGLAAASEAIFDLDFHAVMHWGRDPVLEKHYVPKRSQRARSVLTFFAQDSGTHNLVYANADLSKATQAREALAFCDHWKQISGTDPAMLVMDQKVTTQQVLGELDARGVKFLTLRMRSPALARHIASLRPADFKTVTLDRPGHFGQPARPRVHEDPAAKLTAYPGTVRQLIVTALGHDQPTVIITNDQQATTRNLIGQYARRMTIEQRLAEIIRAFCADALSSTVNLNVDLDVMLAVLGQALLAALRARLPGYAAAAPDTIQRRFLETPGQITASGDTITVRLERRAYSPVLRKAALRPPPPSPGGATAPPLRTRLNLAPNRLRGIRAKASYRSTQRLPSLMATSQARCSWTRLLRPIVWSPSRHAGTILGANMAYVYDWIIRGSQPRNEEERRKRKIFLGYLDALLEPVDMKSRFATSFWPHDLLPGDQRPPEGAGIEAMEQFRERINTACTAVRSATVTWIEDGAALSMLAGGADPADLVGASMVVTYVHDRGPLVLPGSGRVYEPTGKALVLDVSDAVRIDSDGMITDRWSGLSFAHLHWQLEQNATP